MRYDINTAGGIMSPDYLALPDDMAIGEAILTLLVWRYANARGWTL